MRVSAACTNHPPEPGKRLPSLDRMPNSCHVCHQWRLFRSLRQKRSPAAVEGFEHILRLSFADVDFLNPELSSRAKEKIPAAFTPAHAPQIRSFIEQLPPAISSVVVHCEGGFSRSCAVVLGLHKLHGYQVDIADLEQANPSIVQVLMRQPATKRR